MVLGPRSRQGCSSAMTRDCSLCIDVRVRDRDSLRHEQGCTSALTRDLSHDQGLFFVDVRVRDRDSLRHEQGSQA